MEILDPVPDGQRSPSPTQQGLLGLNLSVLGAMVSFSPTPTHLREMTQYKDTRLRGCVCVHALIQSCLLQAQLCLNKETKETESYDPFPQPPSCVP